VTDQIGGTSSLDPQGWPLAPGDGIAGVDTTSATQRTGLVVEVLGGPDDHGKYEVVIETRDQRKGRAGEMRQYTVWWPVQA
jgi:hypothetical protein